MGCCVALLAKAWEPPGLLLQSRAEALAAEVAKSKLSAPLEVAGLSSPTLVPLAVELMASSNSRSSMTAKLLPDRGRPGRASLG